MSLLDALRAGIKVADKVTKPLQATVIYEREASVDHYGNVTPNSPVSLRAIVDNRRLRRIDRRSSAFVGPLASRYASAAARSSSP